LLSCWYRPRLERGLGTSVKVEGMVTIQQIEIIGSQVLKASLLGSMDAVHRLNGGGFGFIVPGLKI
jgi:hypothetical protein